METYRPNSLNMYANFDAEFIATERETMRDNLWRFSASIRHSEVFLELLGEARFGDASEHFVSRQVIALHILPRHGHEGFARHAHHFATHLLNRVIP